MTVGFEAPAKLMPLLQPARYKAAYGGRGGAKSWFYAGLAVARAYAAPTRIVCIREVQNSLRESVIQLIRDQIERMHLGNAFREANGEFTTPWGSQIIFKGMQSYNAGNIKSLEGFDVAWVEEAQYFSRTSLKILRPTIRKANSELWFSWNPRDEEDAVDALFRSSGVPPRGAIIIEVGWQDNPWFDDVLYQEMLDDYARDPEDAEHIWGGGYEKVTEASYYAKLLLQVEREGRVGAFPYEPEKHRLRTSWDIGVDDYTAIWVWADDGETATAVDYWETQGEGVPQIVSAFMPELNPDREAAWAQLVELDRTDPWFKYAEHFLPHDVKVREWGGGAKSRVQWLHEYGVKPIRVGVQTKPDDRIAAGRKLLATCRFHAAPRVLKGLKRLRNYKRRLNEQLQVYSGPLKDGNDHAADAFGEYAMNAALAGLPAPKAKPAFVQIETPRGRIMVPHQPPKALPQQTIDEAWDQIASPRFRGV